jgi:hypothetical protein
MDEARVSTDRFGDNSAPRGRGLDARGDERLGQSKDAKAGSSARQAGFLASCCIYVA